MWPFDRKPKTEAKPRKRRGYDGARLGRLTFDWITSGASQDAEVATTLPRLRNRSRDLVRNNDYARAAVRGLVNNVVGKGIGLQAQIYKQRGGKPNDRLNKQIEELWQVWGKGEYCHTEGKLGFAEIERLVFRSVVESGEVFIRIINQSFAGSPVPLALEVIEADQLDDTLNTGSTGANGNIIRLGIEQDQWRRPVAYHFWAEHPGDYGFTHVQNRSRHFVVPADQIIHLFVTDRPGQTRGVPWLHSAMSRLRQLGGYEEAELVAARAQAAVMGFIESEYNETLGDEEIQGQSTRSLEPGVIEQLNPGEKFAGFAPTRPGDGFDPFVRMMLRGVAAGCGMSYESLSRDFSNTSYSSARTALLDERDHYRIIQEWLLCNFHRKIYKHWLMAAVLSGAISIPNFEQTIDKYCQAKWTPRGWGWVDPVKEITAYKEAIRAGLSSTSYVLAQSGLDLETVLEERQRELELAEAYGVELDTTVAEEAGYLAQEED